jgi:hypothetical protein
MIKETVTTFERFNAISETTNYETRSKNASQFMYLIMGGKEKEMFCEAIVRHIMHTYGSLVTPLYDLQGQHHGKFGLSMHHSCKITLVIFTPQDNGMWEAKVM